MPPEPNYETGSAYHQQRRWMLPHTQRCLEAAFEVLGQPASLLDVGCAEGALVRWASQQQVTAAGIDLAASEDPELVRADLCEPVDLGRQFQWVLCWEVAEHLPESAADVLCETIVHHMAPGGRILWTAARPGQRGPGHINCQPSRYWMEKFAALGVVVSTTESQRLRSAWLRCAPKTPWYGNNVQVFWRVA